MQTLLIERSNLVAERDAAEAEWLETLEALEA